ncbi:hypothetical protein ABH925_001316 [Streptacidiphilus sp. EB129]
MGERGVGNISMSMDEEGPRRPLSAGQQALWLAHRLAPGSAAYTIVLPVRIRGPLRVEALGAAVEAVSSRHPLLRSRFGEADGEPYRSEPCRGACAGAGGALLVREVPGAGDAELAALVREYAARPFRLAEEPPFLVVLLRRSEEDAVLVVSADHIVSDYASQHLMLREILDAHREFADAGRWAQPPAPYPYDDQVAEERLLLASPRGARAERYWQQVRDGAGPAELPTDRPRPATPGFRGGTRDLEIPDGTARRLTATAGALDSTPFAFLLGVFQAALYRWTGQGDGLIGCPMSTRVGQRTRDTVGYFVNPVPVRSAIGSADTVADVVTAAQRQLIGGMAYAGYPCALLGADRGGRHAPLFRIALTMITTDRQEPVLGPVGGTATEGPAVEYAGLRISRMATPQQEGQLDLMVRIEQSEGALNAAFSYDADLFDADTVERFAGHFGTLLEKAAENPGATVESISLVDQDALARLLALGAGTV